MHQMNVVCFSNLPPQVLKLSGPYVARYVAPQHESQLYTKTDLHMFVVAQAPALQIVSRHDYISNLNIIKTCYFYDYISF